MRMVKILDRKLYEEKLKSVQPGEEEPEGRPSCDLQHPHKGKRRARYQSLHSCDQCQALRIWHEAEMEV